MFELGLSFAFILLFDFGLIVLFDFGLEFRSGFLCLALFSFWIHFWSGLRADLGLDWV